MTELKHNASTLQVKSEIEMKKVTLHKKCSSTEIVKQEIRNSLSLDCNTNNTNNNTTTTTTTTNNNNNNQ